MTSKHYRKLTMVVALVAAGTAVGTRAAAQTTESAPLSDAEVRARVARIQAVLDERSGRVKLWQYGWLGLGYSVTAGFAAISATAGNSTDRLDFAFASGGALVDTTIHALGSINVHAAARLRESPATTPAEWRAKLRLGEEELRQAAEDERDRHSLLKGQVLPIGFTLATGMVLWLGFGHLKGAAINSAASIVVNEVRFLTQPTSATDSWTAYQTDPTHVAAHAPSGFTWSVVPTPLGCGVVGTF